MIKTAFGIRWRIKSKQWFGYIIENVDKPADIRRISFDGWEQFK